MDSSDLCPRNHVRTYKTHDGRDAAAPAAKVCVECLHAEIGELLAKASPEARKGAHDALSDACHIVWHHKSVEHEGCEHRPHFWSIPADRNRDVDLRIGEMLTVLDKLVEALQRGVS